MRDVSTPRRTLRRADVGCTPQADGGSECATRRAANAAGKGHKSTMTASGNMADENHIERDSETLGRGDAAVCVALDELG